MIKKITIAAAIMLLIAIQISILPNFFPARAVPDVALVLLILWTTRRGLEKVWKLAVLTGIFLDLLSFLPVGMNVFSLIVTLFAVDYLARRFLVSQRTWRFFILVLISVFGTILNEILLLLLFSSVFWAEKISANALSFWDASMAHKIIYNILLLVILYWPLKKLEDILNLYGARAELKTNVG